MEGYYPFNSNKKLQWPKRSSWRLIYLQLSYGWWWHFGKSSTHFIIMLISKYSCTLISCSNGFQGKNKCCLFYRWNSVSAFIENIKKLFEAGLLLSRKKVWKHLGWQYVFSLLCSKLIYLIVFGYLYIHSHIFIKREKQSSIQLRNRKFGLFITTKKWLW